MSSHQSNKNTYKRLRPKIKFRKVITAHKIMHEELDCIFSDINKIENDDCDNEKYMKHLEYGMFGEIYGESEQEHKKPLVSESFGKNKRSWKDVFKLDDKGNVIVIKEYKHMVRNK